MVWLVPALIVIARRRPGLAQHAQARSLPRDRLGRPAARHPGRGAGLEVAVHLSRAGHRGGEPDGDPEPDGRSACSITSDTVMNSFYVPALAGQIYAMAGMQTRLQMLADAPGKFVGRNTQYSGGGFSDQYLRGAGDLAGGFRRLGGQGQAGDRQARRRRLRQARREEPARSDRLLFGVRAQAVRFASSPSTATPITCRRPARRRPSRRGDRPDVRQTDDRSPAALQRHRRDRRRW